MISDAVRQGYKVDYNCEDKIYSISQGNNVEAYQLKEMSDTLEKCLVPNYNLSKEILKNIFKQLLPKKLNIQKMNSLLEGCTWTSKNWHYSSNKVKKEWVESENISLRKFSYCQTAKKAVKFIIKNKLKTANLFEFSDLTDDDLSQLIKNSANLNSLSIRFYKITNKRFVEILKTFTQLQHLNLNGVCLQSIGPLNRSLGWST
jgi:hypothetical protein